MPAFWSFFKGCLKKQYRGERRPRRPQRRKFSYIRLGFEMLEDRIVPASYSWTGGAGTLNWADAGNWSGTVVPGSGDDVTINKSGVGTIAITGAQSVRTLNDTTAALSIASGGSLSLAAVAASSTFGQNVTVQSGGALSVGAGASVLLQPNVTLTDSGTMTMASGDTLSLSSNYPGGTQLVVNGTLSLSGDTVNAPGQGYGGVALTVNSGGELTASNTTFSLSTVTLAAGSVFNPGDLSNDAFACPLYLPITDVPLLSAAGGGADNQSFQDIDILPGTLASGTVALEAIGSVSTANLRYVFPGAFTVAAGATLSVGPNVPVLVQPGVTLTDSGTMTMASGDTLTLSSNYPGGTQVVVNGTLSLSGDTVNLSGQGYGNDNLTVNSGGRLIASGTTFALSQVTLAAGSVFNPGDLSNDAFACPLYLPITDVPLLSAAGGGSDNQSFQDIDILAGTLASGQSVALNAIGTVSTAGLRYVFPGAFTVAAGATLTVGPNVPVLVQPNVTLTDSGAMSLASGDTLTLSTNYPGGAQVVVNGTLAASGATFNLAGQGYGGDALTVNSGGHFTPRGCALDLPLFLPAVNVADLGGAGDNLRFQDIDILPGTLGSGQSVALDAIGTDTSKLRYVFTGAFTINPGATLTVGPNVPVLVQPNVTLTDSGAMSLASGDTLSLSSNYPGGTQVVVNGTLSLSGDTVNAPGQGYGNDNLTVNSGGHLTASGTTFSLSTVTLSSGSTDTIQVDAFSCTLAIDSGATRTINQNDLSNVPGNNNGIVATGSPAATIDLTNNFWGTGATAAQIAAKIKDHVTDATRPTVLYQPYLSNEPTQTTAAPVSTLYNTAAQNITLSATVIYAGGNINQGTATFTVLSGTTVIGTPVTVNVTNGVATATYTLPAATAPATYTIQAVYNGTSLFAGSSDTSHLLTVRAASTTTAAANASTTYSTASQSVPVSATVTSAAGTVNAGIVTFTILNGSTPVGNPVTANVTSGSASTNYTLPAGTSGGTYTLQAVYNGTASFPTSTDTSHTLTVNPAATTTAGVTAGAVFSAASQAVALSATVSSPAGTVNGGTVTFTVLNGSTVVGTAQSASVVNGAAGANYTLPAGLADGSYTIQVAYAGSTNFTASADSSHSLFVGTIMWVAPGGGSWDTASNWSANRTPTATDDVVIVRPGATVTKSGGSVTVQSVMSTAALSFSSTSMTLTAGQSQFQAGLTLTSGAFNFNGGSISGTVTLNGSALAIGSGSTGGELRPRRVGHPQRQRGGGADALGPGQRCHQQQCHTHLGRERHQPRHDPAAVADLQLHRHAGDRQQHFHQRRRWHHPGGLRQRRGAHHHRHAGQPRADRRR